MQADSMGSLNNILKGIEAKQMAQKQQEMAQQQQMKQMEIEAMQKEKAAERSRHYRKVKREKAGAFEVVEGTSRTLKRVNGEVIPVQLTPEEREREASRGLKPKKEKMPKENSERKAYVGSKMKKQFMEAGGDEKQLKRAKRLYKEKGISWEEVIRQVLR
jgi:hypothetical protein